MPLGPAEQFEYDVLNHKWKNIDRVMTEKEKARYNYLVEKLTNTGGGRPKPSKKRSTHRRRRSSKVRKSRTTRRR
jgi:hypothetical protein